MLERKAVPDALWVELTQVLANHRGASAFKKLVRLLEKHPARPTPSPQLRENRLLIEAQEWGTERLWAALDAAQHTEKNPHAAAGAIVVLRCADTDFVLDGRRRINHWHRTCDQGMHRVLLIKFD